MYIYIYQNITTCILLVDIYHTMISYNGGVVYAAKKRPPEYVTRHRVEEWSRGFLAVPGWRETCVRQLSVEGGRSSNK